MIIPATWDELARKYHELVAAVWGCPIDELDEPDLTHESTVAEVDRQIKAEVKASIEVERLRAENQVLDLKTRNSLGTNLCPDHRDKQKGKPCLACEIERLKAELDQARADYQAYVDGVCEALQ